MCIYINALLIKTWSSVDHDQTTHERIHFLHFAITNVHIVYLYKYTEKTDVFKITIMHIVTSGHSHAI